MKDRVKRKIELAKEIIGISTSQLANLTGVAASTLSRQLTGAATSELKAATVDKMDAAVRDHISSGKATEEQVGLYREEYLALSPGEAMPDIIPAQTDQPAQLNTLPHERVAFPAGPGGIPVKRTAPGREPGSMQVSSETVEFVHRPPSLASAKNAFAIYIVGESMSPQHNPGDLRFVHPDRPPARGDSVLVVTHTLDNKAKHVFVKIFDGREGNKILCHQYNPRQSCEFQMRQETKEIQEEANTACSVYKILSLNELLGF